MQVGEPVAELVVEQALGVEGFGEQDPHGDGVGLGGEDGGDPLAGDQVDDGVRVLRGGAGFELFFPGK